MLSRIDECIQFDDIPDDLKLEIAKSHYRSIVDELDNKDRLVIEQSDIQEWFHRNISRYSNMRTLKKTGKSNFRVLIKKIIDDSMTSSS